MTFRKNINLVTLQKFTHKLKKRYIWQHCKKLALNSENVKIDNIRVILRKTIIWQRRNNYNRQSVNNAISKKNITPIFF